MLITAESSTELRGRIEEAGNELAVRSAGLSGVTVTATHPEHATLTATGNTLHAALGALASQLGALA